ncbi:hypothetical protein Tco_0512126 [Tanacetum coccineum]
MMTYLKNMGGYKHYQLKGKTFEEIQGMYERHKKMIDDFKPMDLNDKVKGSEKPAGGSRKKTIARKRVGITLSKEGAKKQKLEDVTEEEKAADYEQEKEELRIWLKVVQDEEETVNPEILNLRMIYYLDEKDDIWLNQQDWKLLKWKLYENYRVHTLFIDGTPLEINMLVEKKYPLIKELLEKMLKL